MWEYCFHYKTPSLGSQISLTHPYTSFIRYSNHKVFMSWQLLHGRAFVFARTDWEYVFNTFAFGYAIGYHFIASPHGSCNGNFLGIGNKATFGAWSLCTSIQIDRHCQCLCTYTHLCFFVNVESWISDTCRSGYDCKLADFATNFAFITTPDLLNLFLSGQCFGAGWCIRSFWHSDH